MLQLVCLLIGVFRTPGTLGFTSLTCLERNDGKGKEKGRVPAAALPRAGLSRSKRLRRPSARHPNPEPAGAGDNSSQAALPNTRGGLGKEIPLRNYSKGNCVFWGD